VPRRIDGAWAVALAAGAAGALLLPRPVSLADPPGCAGLLELAGIIASRTVRDVPLGGMIVWANRLLVAVALILFVRLVQRVTGDRAGSLAAVAAAAALFFSFPFESVLAPTHAAAFAAASAVVLAVLDPRAPGRAAGRWRAVLALALLTAVAPALLFPSVILAWALVRLDSSNGGALRAIPIAAAIAAVLIGPAIVTIAAPPLPAVGVRTPDALHCAPNTIAIGIGTAIDAMRAAFGPMSLYAIALAAVGAFTARGALIRTRIRWLAFFAILPVLAASLDAPDAARTLAPVVVLVWLLAAFGLREIVLAIAPRGPRWIAALLVLASLPWLQFGARPEPVVADADRLRGHEALNWRRFLQVLSAIPAGGGLIVEDAVVSMLATDAGRRRAQAGRPVVFVPPARDQVARILARTSVFALPRRQSTLRHLGFQLVDLSPRAPGVTEVRAGLPCALADGTWREAEMLTFTPGFALVADDDLARGPVSLALGGDGSLAPERVWPGRAERGFSSTEVDRQAAGGDARFRGTLTSLGLPATHPFEASRFLTSVDLWRVPGGPFILPVKIRQPPSAALIRRRADAVPGRVWICPSVPYEVKPLVEPQ
jgi:hypothetical protein